MEPLSTPPPAMPPPMADPAPYTPPPAGGTAYAKADLGKRFVAYLIDAIILGLCYGILGIFGVRGAGLGMLIGAAYILVRDGLAYDFADGRSVGKKIMKLRPVRLDGSPMTIEASVRRNWPLALGSIIYGFSWLLGGWTGLLFLGMLGMIASLLGLVEAVLVLTDKDGRRIGDKMAETQVIDAGA